jgi:hypothetical protein
MPLKKLLDFFPLVMDIANTPSLVHFLDGY